MSEDYSSWVGRSRTRHAPVDQSDLSRLAAVLDFAEAPTATRPTWHWACFPDPARQSRLGPDGHPLRGDFLPPITAPRRMFASADIQMSAPLEAGQATVLVETIASVETRTGRTGALTFVGLDRTFEQAGTVCIRERQTFVYREADGGPWRKPAPSSSEHQPQWRDARSADTPMLFRYSAATFNSHRIHYDRDYAVGEEGYPGLVVHGPLLATLLAESVSVRFPDARMQRFAFRASRPIFEGETFFVCGRLDGAVAALWIEADDGGVAMTARAELALAK